MCCNCSAKFLDSIQTLPASVSRSWLFCLKKGKAAKLCNSCWLKKGRKIKFAQHHQSPSFPEFLPELQTFAASWQNQLEWTKENKAGEFTAYFWQTREVKKKGLLIHHENAQLSSVWAPPPIPRCRPTPAPGVCRRDGCCGRGQRRLSGRKLTNSLHPLESKTPK